MITMKSFLFILIVSQYVWLKNSDNKYNRKRYLYLTDRNIMDVESHKRSHKPVVHLTESGEVKGTHQGYYVPQHPEKIIGSPAELIYRSGWERDLCRWCDDNPNVRK